jgi:hypothetical protein
MASIEGDDQIGVEALRERDDRGIDAAEREVSIDLDELSDSRPILWMRALDPGAREASDERSFSFGTQSLGDEIESLGDDEGRYDKSESRDAETPDRSFVVGV